MTTNAALVSRTQDGDAEAFRALYERHRPAVERLCRKWLRDPDLVEDAVQSTFLKAWAALPNFVGGADVDRWLRRIAKNHCHDVWRAMARVEALGCAEDPSVELEDPASVRLAGECVDRLAVETMLRNLGRRDASLLVQRHIGDAPVSALAAQWGLTRGAMDVALHRARLRARRLAAAEGLRALLPLGLLRRFSTALQRFAPLSPDAGVVFMGVCNIVVAVALSAPHMAPAYADERQSSMARPIQIVNPAVRQPSRPVADADPRHRTATTAAEARSRESKPALKASQQPPEDQHLDRDRPAAPPQPSSAVAFEPVSVPATGRTVRSTPDYEKPDWVIGARAPNEDVSVEEGSTPMVRQAAPVVEAACTVADAADPVTYCTE